METRKIRFTHFTKNRITTLFETWTLRTSYCLSQRTSRNLNETTKSTLIDLSTHPIQQDRSPILI
ncbi:hypothetical protein EMIT0111MI5_30220 [Burkholderia sp. IT-111MI5]